MIGLSPSGRLLRQEKIRGNVREQQLLVKFEPTSKGSNLWIMDAMEGTSLAVGGGTEGCVFSTDARLLDTGKVFYINWRKQAGSNLEPCRDVYLTDLPLYLPCHSVPGCGFAFMYLQLPAASSHSSPWIDCPSREKFGPALLSVPLSSDWQLTHCTWGKLQRWAYISLANLKRTWPDSQTGSTSLSWRASLNFAEGSNCCCSLYDIQKGLPSCKPKLFCLGYPRIQWGTWQSHLVSQLYCPLHM